MNKQLLVNVSPLLMMILLSCGDSPSSYLKPGFPNQVCEFHHIFTNNPDEASDYRIASRFGNIEPLESKAPWLHRMQRTPVCDTQGPYGHCWSTSLRYPKYGSHHILYGPYQALPSGGKAFVEVKYVTHNSGVTFDVAAHGAHARLSEGRVGPGAGTWTSAWFDVGAGIPDLEVRAFNAVGLNDKDPEAYVRIDEVRIIHRKPDFMMGNPECQHL